MSRPQRAFLLWLAVLACATFLSGGAGRAMDDKGEAVPSFDRLKPGMTPEQVIALVGRPKRIARQILYHRYLEQWIYDAPQPVRLTFDCRRGRKPQLLAPPLPRVKDEKEEPER